MSDQKVNQVPVQELSYEAAREELRNTVQALEAGSAPLEETLALWKRGEELARYCRHILEKAQKQIDAAAQANNAPESGAEEPF